MKRAVATELAYRARDFYPSVLPYHDWSHALDVMDTAGRIADIAVDPEIRDARGLLVIAAGWHDADYANDDFSQHSTREERSAALVGEHLRGELADEEIELIQSGIIDTTVTKWPKSSLFGEVLHAADTGYFAAPYAQFMGRLTLMRLEWDAPWEQAVSQTITFGHTVIQEAGHLMPQILTRDAADAWVNRIRVNMRQLETEFADGRLK